MPNTKAGQDSQLQAVVVSVGPDGALALDKALWRTIEDVALDSGLPLIDPFRIGPEKGLCFNPHSAGFVGSIVSNWLAEQPELHRLDSVSGYALRRFARLAWSARDRRVRMRVFARAA